MSLNDYLKCPGLDRTLANYPVVHRCVVCGNDMEIWTDEKKGRCHNCGHVVESRNFFFSSVGCRDSGEERSPSEDDLRQLLQTAGKLGASDAMVIRSDDIVVDDDLANLCLGNPPCKNYGLSISCPPHVPGPSEFRVWQKQSSYSMVVKIDAPSEILFSSGRREIGQLLHEIVAEIEQEAIGMGYVGSKALASGSCKIIFCHDHLECRSLSKQAACRNPNSSRPSMSGFGINVSQLMQTAGWSTTSKNNDDKLEESMSWIAGLIVIVDKRID